MFPHATGFFISVDDVFHLVTAKHVVYDKVTSSFVDQELHYFTNSKVPKTIYYENIKKA